MATRVYADDKGGRCSCGGRFSKRMPHEDEPTIDMPLCDLCLRRPRFYYIDVDAKDESGVRITFRIRYTKDAKRLTTPTRVAYIFQVIQDEVASGSFNVRHYDSSKSKEAFIFKNYVLEYLAHQERRFLRKEISPKGLLDKKGLLKRELLPFFGNMEIFRIKDVEIRRFKDQYVSKLRTRDLALGELKALLNQAERDGMISKAPKFEPIPRSKKRDTVISMELAVKTVEAMPKQVYRDFYALLLIYPIRPGELRALKWSEVDFGKNRFTIDHHFSSEILIPGRKSIGKDQKEGSISFPMNPEAREIFTRIKMEAKIVSLTGDDFVFMSRFGRHFAETSIWEAWDLARKKINHTFAPYECRHASASELYKKVKGDLIRMKEVGGWTNTSTLERYVTSRQDSDDLF